MNRVPQKSLLTAITMAFIIVIVGTVAAINSATSSSVVFAEPDGN